MSGNRTVQLIDLGLTDYLEALALQRGMHALRRDDACGDTLLLTEHRRVLTIGRGADDRFLRVSPPVLAEHGIGLVRTERGGDITYHGPGQLVAYPILDLRNFGRDLRRYIRALEETALRLLATYGVEGRRAPGTPGVWVGAEKIASVGVFVSRWVAMHGIAINIAPSLEDFGLIHPCGLVGQRMTSVAALLGDAPPLGAAVARYAEVFAAVFDVVITPGHPPQACAAQAPRDAGPRRADR
jgi:lipoate-protein ligase B